MLKKQNPTLSPKRFESKTAVDLVETIASLTRGFSVGTGKPSSKQTGGLGDYKETIAPMTNTKRGVSDLKPDFGKALWYTGTVPTGALGVGDMMMWSDYMTSKIPVLGKTNVGRSVIPTAGLNLFMNTFLQDIGYKGDAMSELGTSGADKTKAQQEFEDVMAEFEKQQKEAEEEAKRNAEQQNESFNKIEYASCDKKGTPFINYTRGFIVD